MDEFRPLTGQAFRDAVANRPPSPTPIAEEFLYERRVMMISADAGAGKSTVVGQTALAFTSAENTLFKYLQIPRARNVYYIQLEGSMDETLERTGYMQQELTIDWDRIYWDPMEYLDCSDKASVNETIQRIGSWGRRPDVIVIDPIYMAVSGDLRKGDVSSALVRFSERLKRTFGCANILVHHTHRTQYSRDGKRITETDPYYGSQWLKAHVDTSYLLTTPTEEGDQGKSVEMSCRKMRGGNVKSHFALKFDAESFTNYIDMDRSRYTGEQLLIHHLEGRQRENRDSSFHEALEATRLSPAHLRRLQETLRRNGILQVLRLNGSRGKIWRLSNSNR